MPELPEVETVRRGLEPAMLGARIDAAVQTRPDLRFPFPENFVERLQNTTIQAVRRRAKYLLVDLSSGETVLMHLGMSGSFRIDAGNGTGNTATASIADRNGRTERPGAFHYPRHEAKAHDHFWMTLSNGNRIIFNDPRRFGFVVLHATQDLDEAAHLRHLGVEPLGNGLHAGYLNAALRHKRTPLKSALLDQRIIAGLGNIYVCEALFQAGLSPRRVAGTICTARGAPGQRVERLVAAIRSVLADAIEAGGSTLRDFSHADGELGYFQHRFTVYGREAEPCTTPKCRNVVQRIVQSGRSTFFCAHCQR